MKNLLSLETVINLLTQIKAGTLELAFTHTKTFNTEYWTVENSIEDSLKSFTVWKSKDYQHDRFLEINRSLWFSSLEVLGFWKRPETVKLDQSEHIVFEFHWSYSGMDSSRYESNTINCFVTNKARCIHFGTNGEYSNFFGDKGYGISSSQSDGRIELPSRDEILFTMGISYSDKIYSVLGGSVSMLSEEYFLLTQAGFKGTSVTCYGGSQRVSLCDENESTRTLVEVAEGKCVELCVWESNYDEDELLSTEYFWFFPNKSRPVKLGINKTYRLLRKLGGIIPKEMSNFMPTEGEGWKLY